MKKQNPQEEINVMKIDKISLDDVPDTDTFEQDQSEFRTEAVTSAKSPHQRGEAEISGSQPDVEADDDVLENAHQVGIAVNEDLENPTELNIAQDVENAEKLRRKK